MSRIAFGWGDSEELEVRLKKGLGKFADIGKLVEAASKAWELIQKGM